MFMKNKLVFAISLVSYIGIATALPLVIFGLGGRYLDKIYNTTPKLFLIGIAIASVISYLTLRNITYRAIKILNKMQKDKD